MINNNPLVSVILPVYNTSEYLHRCLESVLSQTYANIEIILIDDGSTDNSVEICTEYSNVDSRVTLVSQENKGAYIARNNGMSVAKGEWLIFVDSDDWIDPDGIEGLITMVNKYPEIDMIRSYNRQVSNASLSLNKKNKEPSGKLFTREELLLKNKIGGFMSSMFIKRNIVTKNNLEFSSKYKTKMDLVFTFKYVLNCTWILVYDKVYYNYFIRENSLSRSVSFEKSIVHLKASELIYNYSKNFKSQIIDNYVKESLNIGLSRFYVSIIELFNTDDINISNQEFKKNVKEFLDKNELSFNNLSLKNKIFTVFTIFDYRGLRFLVYANNLKKAFKWKN